MSKSTIDLRAYDTYIVDMDGTLYFKRAMQLRMLFSLAGYYITHPFKLKELLILAKYRKLRDKDDISENPEFEKIIAEELSKRYSVPEDRVRNIIRYWILQKPLQILAACSDRRLHAFLAERKAESCKFIVYSDYPAAEKCKAIGVHPDDVFWPDGERICVLKPSSAGVKYIVSQHNLDVSKTLFIGDRYEKDGVCAKNSGMDYLILKKSRFSRTRQYKHLF